MLKQLKFVSKLLLGFVILLMFFSSCVPIKKQVYFQAAEDTLKTAYQYKDFKAHKLQTANDLYVRVFSINKDAGEFFNQGISSSGNIYYDAAIYLNSYNIDNEGYVDLPFIGKLHVRGLTTVEAKAIIQEEIDKYLNSTTVIVKLVNYNISIVGEVIRPGQYKIYQDRINIFEVISLAGDLTTYAKRDDIVLVRKQEKDAKIFHINLLEDNVMESEYYYILPDDIIYVKPVKGKNFAFSAFPYTLVISTISLTLALVAIFN